MVEKLWLMHWGRCGKKLFWSSVKHTLLTQVLCWGPEEYKETPYSGQQAPVRVSELGHPTWERRDTIHGWCLLVWVEWQNFCFQQMLATCWQSLLVGQKTDIVFALHIQNLFPDSLGLDKGRRKQTNKQKQEQLRVLLKLKAPVL